MAVIVSDSIEYFSLLPVYMIIHATSICTAYDLLSIQPVANKTLQGYKLLDFNVMPLRSPAINFPTRPNLHARILADARGMN